MRILINIIKKSKGDDAFLKITTQDNNSVILNSFKIDINKFNNEVLKL